MPTIYNGIGTWYYGKKRLHRLMGTCAFCNRVGELQSYDTTLYFVFVMVPLLPLSHKRVLDQCPWCQRHRVLPLREWETAKEKQIAELLARLQQNPDDRASILHGLGLAMGYQDEELFNKLASSLAQDRRDDPAIQAQLGAGYCYFAHYPEAEDAYRAALAVDNTPEVQRQLALVLLKQGRPEEAFPYLLSILENKETENAGMIFLLVEGLQAQGLHEQALELMDLRDETFPDLANLDVYKKQRKLSRRYQNTSKKIRSAYFTESQQVGYRKGGWTAALPRLIGPLVGLALLVLYLGSAFWIGQSRKIYLVNGWDQLYTVAVNGREQVLRPGATTVHVPEGEVVVEFHDPRLKGEPIHCRIETPFFGRPFFGHSFVINPDRLAVVVHEKCVYSDVPQPAVDPPQYHSGEVQYDFTGIDYEFTPFPQTLQADKGSTITKTRIGLELTPTPETRLGLIGAVLAPNQQQEYARRLLQLDPDNVYFLSFVLKPLPADEAVAFLKPNLEARPLRVEGHRFYQHLMEKNHPERDLRPDYRKLVAETKNQPDAIYLLARLLDGTEADKMLEQAARADPPSVHAMHSLGWRALARGQFADAIRWLEKAQQLAPTNSFVRKDFQSALTAAGQYDRLLREIDRQPGTAADQLQRLLDKLHVHAARGDKANAQAVTQAAVASVPADNPPQMRQLAKVIMEQVFCSGTGDVAGYLALSTQVPGAPTFEPAFLRGKLKDAANLVEDQQDEDKIRLEHGLLYLAARQAGDQKLADQEWKLLLAALAKGSRHDRQLGEMLAVGKPMTADTLRNLPIDPRVKRVLLLVAAQRQPDLVKELAPLAQKLNFQCDAISLCLVKLSKDGQSLEKAKE
jgi:tetratricopeptide (TPR) repeat protein